MKIGLIGTGAIGAPIARHMAKSGFDLKVSPRNAETAWKLSEEFANIEILENQEIIDECEGIFIALRPEVAHEALSSLTFRKGQRICSVMANVSMQNLKELCSPADQIGITIPLAFLENGGCPLPVFGDVDLVSETIGSNNPVLLQASEDALNSHFAGSTLISTVLTCMIAGSEWLADQTNDPANADIYVNALISGFLRDIPKRGAGDLLEARQDLATEGTLNIAMVDALVANGTPKLVKDALENIQDSMRT